MTIPASSQTPDFRENAFMDYQITCVCGHRFLVSEDKVTSQVTCPACHQRLSPVIEASRPPPPASKPPALVSSAASDPASPNTSSPALSAAAEETKRCPFCGEVILAIARKCKHCGEFLDRAQPGFPPGPAAVRSVGLPRPQPQPLAADVPLVYEFSISQWDNFWKFIILITLVVLIGCILVFVPPLKEYAVIGTIGAAVLAMFFAWFFYLGARNTRYTINALRINVEHGVITKQLTSLELFRITDLDLKQGIVERILHIGTIRLNTTEADLPELLLYQIPKAREVYKYLQNQIPLVAKMRGAVYMEK